MKTCKGCGDAKPLSAFGTLRGKPKSRCNDCYAAESRARYAKNPEKYIGFAKRYQAENAEKYKQRQRHYQRERGKELQRLRYHEKIEQKREYFRRYAQQRIASLTPEEKRERRERLRPVAREYAARQRAERPEVVRERKRAWRRRTNYESDHAYHARRRAQKRTTQVVTIRRCDIVKRDGNACYLCGVVLAIADVTLDHVVPLSRGGTHTPDNLRVACRPCNSSKGAKLPSELRKGRVIHV